MQNLWDCGGQNAFTDNYLTAQKDTIFTNVAVLIYVFDITSTEWESDLKYFEDIIGTLRENSSDAGVWVLINKMDLADKEDPQRRKFAEKKAEILAVDEKVALETEKKGLLRVFGTTIWDESLYKVSYRFEAKPTKMEKWLTGPGLVFSYSHTGAQHQPHYITPDVPAQPLPRSRDRCLRGRDILGNRKVWLPT